MGMALSRRKADVRTLPSWTTLTETDQGKEQTAVVVVMGVIDLRCRRIDLVATCVHESATRLRGSFGAASTKDGEAVFVASPQPSIVGVVSTAINLAVVHTVQTCSGDSFVITATSRSERGASPRTPPGGLDDPIDFGRSKRKFQKPVGAQLPVHRRRRPGQARAHEVVDLLRNPDQAKLELQGGKGCLLVGTPRTELFVGVGASRVKGMFDAADHQPAETTAS